MTREPLISVVTPVYNGARYLEGTISSLLAQRYPRLEIIVVNDGSTDESGAVLARFGNAIKVISQENTGHVIARNTGLRSANGDIVGFIDQDDVWPEGRIPRMLPFLVEDGYDYVRGKTLLFGERIQQDTPIFRYANIGACLYRASVIERVGLFDEMMDAGEDFDWHVRIEEAGCKEKRIEDITLLYRQHTTNLSHTDGFLARGQFMTLRKKIRRTHQRASNPSSVWRS